MKFDKTVWIASFTKAVKDLPKNGASDGIVCALATVRTIRDGIINDVTGGKPQTEWDESQNDTVNAVKDSLNELIKQLTSTGKAEAGFASNASGAAAAAKLKVASGAAVTVMDE